MELNVSERGAVIALPQRRYTVQRRGRTTYRDYRVEVRSGATVTLEEQRFRTIAYDRLVRKGGGQRTVIHGLNVMGGLHGETMPGFGPLAEVSLAYTVDLAWASLGVRGRSDWARQVGDDGVLVIDYESLALGLVVQRFVDLEVLSLSLGLVVEGVAHRQRFETEGDAPARVAFGLAFGGLVGVERLLTDRLSLRVEGGPTSSLFLQAPVEGGEALDAELESTLQWSTRGGVSWRF